MARCTAKSKQSGAQCKKDAVAGRTVCHIHGGKSLAGIASPTFKDGRYSKFIPSRLGPRYDAARQDTTLLELYEEIALTDARLGDLLSRVDTGESGALWAGLQETRLELIARTRAGDTTGQTIAINLLLELIGQGHADYRAWGEVATVLDQRRKLVESERKRLVEMQQMVSTQQAMTLVQALLESVKRNVGDRDTISAIQADFIRLTTRNDSTVVDVG